MFPDSAPAVTGRRAQFAKPLHNVHVQQPAEVPPDDAQHGERGVEDPQPIDPRHMDPQPMDPQPMDPPQVALSVAGAARGLGVAPATLRSWERRYGLAPSLHTAGGHRRYGPLDLARLSLMTRLVQEGAPPAEAARAAIGAHIDAQAIDAANPFAALLVGTGPGSGAPTARSGRQTSEPSTDSAQAATASSGGGHVLPMPRQARSVRGLARAAMALDSLACQRTVSSALAEQGALATWEDLVRPVLSAIGEKWSQRHRGVEIEHAFSMVVAGALSAHAARLARPRNTRPVLLASVPDELHDLPLLALHAALADVGVFSLVLGARTPNDALQDAIERIGPPVIVLFAQMPGALPPELPGVRPAPTFLLGGPGWVGTHEGFGHVAGLGDAVGSVCMAMGLSSP